MQEVQDYYLCSKIKWGVYKKKKSLLLGTESCCPFCINVQSEDIAGFTWLRIWSFHLPLGRIDSDNFAFLFSIFFFLIYTSKSGEEMWKIFDAVYTKKEFFHVLWCLIFKWWAISIRHRIFSLKSVWFFKAGLILLPPKWQVKVSFLFNRSKDTWWAYLVAFPVKELGLRIAAGQILKWFISWWN